MFKWQICYSSQKMLKIPPWTSMHATSCVRRSCIFWVGLHFLLCMQQHPKARNSSHVSTLCKLFSSSVINQNLRDLQLGDSNSLSQKPFRISPCSYEYFFLTMTNSVTSQYSDCSSWITLFITSRTTKSVKLLVVVGSVSSCDLVSAFSKRKRNILK